jgi:polygalacturonase
MADSRYVYVLGFKGCNGITITNIEAGHSPMCYGVGGTFRFRNCREVAIDRSDLFGGMEGLALENVAGFTFTHSVIRNCSYQSMELRGAEGVTFRKAVIRNNEMSDLILLNGCEGVLFEGCVIRDNKADMRMGMFALFHVTECSGVVVKDTVIANNQAAYLVKGGQVQTVNVKLEGNGFK